MLWTTHVVYGIGGAQDRAMEPGSYSGWYWFVWTLFFAWVWIGALKAELQRILFLLGLWVTLLALAIGAWTGTRGFILLGGYLGLITSVLAAITSAIEVIGHGLRGNPNQDGWAASQLRPVTGDERRAV
ncbi:MAG TPA: GPR1/FUN34/YaaH family transporter [Steroidobacteraceae bacterium]|nr:GPR1/FUN34/YaaH family transporter [Steroidobacteraceae bacterium]